MLNSISNINVSNHVNAVNGNIIKTYKDSYFNRFNLRSNFAEKLFEEDSNIIVIQMVICGDMEVIAELMPRKKYEKMLDDLNT